MADIKYPFTRYRYKVEVDGGQAGFSEVTGFDANIDVVEYREGNAAVPTVQKLPGLRKYGNITLKWGLTDSQVMYNWIKDSLLKNVTRKDVAITLMNEDGEDVATWKIIQAWPIKYTAPEFNATSSEVAIEQLELAHEGMTREK